MTKISAVTLPPAPRIDLWVIPVSGYLPRHDEFRKLLSDAELERAARFVSPAAGTRFAVIHGLTRIILSEYTGLSAAELQFYISEHGKPGLVSDRQKAGLEFNISHSKGHMALVVGSSMPLGVDIEENRPMESAMEIAESYFTKAECDAVRSADATDREKTFFKIWTRKEALMKAHGDGMAVGLANLQVSRGLGPVKAAPVSIDGTGFVYSDIDIIAGCAVSIASQGNDHSIGLRDHSELLW